MATLWAKAEKAMEEIGLGQTAMLARNKHNDGVRMHGNTSCFPRDVAILCAQAKRKALDEAAKSEQTAMLACSRVLL